MDEPMETIRFSAYAPGGEIDLNRLAARLGIQRRYRWEEPMKLDPVACAVAGEGKMPQAYLYYFGGMVFLNCTEEIIFGFLERMGRHIAPLKESGQLRYRERYRLQIEAGHEPVISDDGAVLPRLVPGCIDIISFVIAKSVALERIEERIDVVFDEVEGLIANLDRGRLELPDRDMARLAASILGFKFTSLAHIMVLDKPETTWDDPEEDRLYTTMAGLFELNQRYLEIRHKSETLLDMTGVFTTLSHARRAARLEWIIIVLIAIEIILYLLELFRH